jgi:outer membrane lipoprotein SlyB
MPQPAPVPQSAPGNATRPAPSTPSYATGASPAPQPPALAAPAPPVATAVPPPAPQVCRDCGTIAAITPIEKKGDSSGAGAVIGGIVGGVLGHQVGGGRGKDVATVAGALGGALLGNEVEKSQGAVTAWDVRVRLDDGTSTVIRLDREPSWRVGDKVRIENGRIVGG